MAICKALIGLPFMSEHMFPGKYLRKNICWSTVWTSWRLFRTLGTESSVGFPAMFVTTRESTAFRSERPRQDGVVSCIQQAFIPKTFPVKFVTKLKSVLLSALEALAMMGVYNMFSTAVWANWCLFQTKCQKVFLLSLWQNVRVYCFQNWKP